MKKSHIWTIAVVLLLCLNSAVLIVLWQQKKPLPAGLGHRQQAKDFLIAQLALSPQQIVKFDTLRTRHRRALDSLEGQIAQLKDSLFANLKTAKADSAALNKLADKIGYDQALTEMVTYTHFKQLKAMLNPEQQTKFDQIIDQVLRMIAHGGPPPGLNGKGGMRPEAERGRAAKPLAPHKRPGDRSEVKPEKEGDRPMGPPPGMDEAPPDGPPPGEMPPGPPPGGDKNHRRPPGNADMPPGPPHPGQKPAK